MIEFMNLSQNLKQDMNNRRGYKGGKTKRREGVGPLMEYLKNSVNMW